MKLIALFILLTIPTFAFADIIRTRTVIVRVPVRNSVVYDVGQDFIPNKNVKLTDDEIDRIAEKIVKRLNEEKFRLVGDNSVPVGKTRNLDNEIFGILNKSCIQCHKPGEKRGGVQLFTLDRTLFSLSDKEKEYNRRDKIYHSVDVSNGGTMPKNGEPLSPEQLAIIRRWRDLMKE